MGGDESQSAYLKTLVKERDMSKRIIIFCKDMKTTNMVGLGPSHQQ